MNARFVDDLLPKPTFARTRTQAPKASKKKQVKASLGQGKATKKMNMGYGDDDNDLGADFDDFM